MNRTELLSGCARTDKNGNPGRLAGASQRVIATRATGGLDMKNLRDVKKGAAADDQLIAPVTIFDAEGRVVRVVAAAEFHRAAAAARALAAPGAPDDSRSSVASAGIIRRSASRRGRVAPTEAAGIAFGG